MFSAENKSFVKVAAYFVIAYTFLPVIFYAVIFIYIFKTVSLLSAWAIICVVHIAHVAALIAGTRYVLGKGIINRFVSLDTVNNELEQVIQVFSHKDGDTVSGTMLSPNGLKEKIDSNLFHNLIQKMSAFKKNLNDAHGKIKAYEDIYVRLSSDLKAVENKSNQLTDNSQNFYKNAYSQSTELEAVSRAMDQFATQISGIADHTNKASQVAMETLLVTESGVNQMNGLISAITSITESSKKILDMIKTIDQIAAQTKLLALNATIEANRAGEHGKAFAVVAGEVRDLSVHSTEAAKETSNLVDDAMKNLTQGNEISSRTVEALTRMEEEVHKVSDIIKEIAESSNLQSQGVNRFNESLKEINQLTRQQRFVAKEATSASQELSNHVQKLTKDLSKLKVMNRLEVSPIDRADKVGTGTKQHVNRPLLFVCDKASVPISHEENGRAEGVLNHITRELLEKRMGIDVEYKPMEWDKCNDHMKHGLADAFFTVMTDERAMYCVTHTNAAYTFEQTLWTYMGHEKLDELKKIKSYNDIVHSDFIAASYPGAGWVKMNLEDRGANVKYFDNEFEKLGKKIVDLVVNEPLMGRHKIKQCGISENQFVEIPVVLQTATFQYLFNKNSPYIFILQEIDLYINEMRQDGTMDSILSHYQ